MKILQNIRTENGIGHLNEYFYFTNKNARN